MLQERDIQAQLAAYTARRVSLVALEKWLAEASWNMFNDAPHAVRLIAKINLLISELHDGVIKEAEFRSELELLANNDLVAGAGDAPPPEAPKP